MPNIPAPDDITHVPAPWTLKGTVYQFAWWTPRAQAEAMPTMAYSPLESSSSFSAPDISKPLGGLSVVQIIRYTDSPVGPYDELLVIPGFHEYAIDDEKTGKRVTKRNARITRIYVSQKYTCWNGRISELLLRLIDVLAATGRSPLVSYYSFSSNFLTGSPVSFCVCSSER